MVTRMSGAPFSIEDAKLFAELATKASLRAVETAREVETKATKAVEKVRCIVIHSARR